MKKKFTYLISLAVAMICSSGGVAWGQHIYWGDGWDHCHNNTFSPSCGDTVRIDGNAYKQWIGETNGYASWTHPGYEHNDGETGTAYGHSYNESSASLAETAAKNDLALPAEPADVYYRKDGEVWKISYSVAWSGSATATHSYNGPSDYDGDADQDYKWTVSDVLYRTITAPSGWDVPCSVWGVDGSNNCIYTNSWRFDNGWYHGDQHTSSSPVDHDKITVNLNDVHTALKYVSPHWKHTYWTGSLNTLGDWIWTEHTDQGYTGTGIMKVGASGLRLTGVADQITAAGTTMTTKTELVWSSTNKKLYFDENWNGSYNSVSTPGWNPATDGVTSGQAVGFNKKYEGTAFTVKGGVLALGGNALTNNAADEGDPTTATTDHGNIKVTSDNNILVDAYNKQAPNSTEGTATCDPLFAHHVGYDESTGNLVTTIGANNLHITNSNPGCWGVYFNTIFEPSYTGAGDILIDPSLTYFNAGANFAPTKASSVSIISRDIIVAGGNFVWAPTVTDTIRIDIHPGYGGCNGCGIFDVTNDFTTTNKVDGVVDIHSTDGVDTGSVHVRGNYTHTGANHGSHKVDVGGHIQVDGETDLTAAAGDEMEFLSRASWIKFGDAAADFFKYTGTNKLTVQTNGDCSNNICGAGVGAYILFNGPVTTDHTAATPKSVLIQSDKDYVQMNKGFFHTGAGTGEMKVSGYKYVYIKDVNNNSNGVEIQRTAAGNDIITSPAGWVRIEKPFLYNQTAANATGLTVDAYGLCTNTGCASIDGYVWFEKAVNTTNFGKGFTLIQSHNDKVRMDQGIYHTAGNAASNLTIDGRLGVNIDGTHQGGPNTDTPNSESVYIDNSAGTGVSKILSADGYVEVGDKFTYLDAGKDGNALLVQADGHCYPTTPCIDGGGYVWLKGAVTTTNGAGKFGTTTIQSTHHFVQMDNGFLHTGGDEAMKVQGFTYVDINNPYPTTGAAGSMPAKKAQEGVYIKRNGDGSDLILSNGGHVSVTDPFTYVQTSTTTPGNANGLTVRAQGPCSIIVCAPNTDAQDRGYVALQKHVWTKNDAAGPTTIQSDGQYVRMGQTFTHEGEDGDMHVLAGPALGVIGTGTGNDACDVNCTTGSSPEPILAYPFAHDDRGYVWINGTVGITMNGTIGLSGNAIIRSYGDIVQMDDTVMFTDKTSLGSNFWVDGKWGVRTLGRTNTTNNNYQAADGSATGVHTGYTTTGQGFVTYLSDSGYVDFGNTQTNLIGGGDQYPFNYTGQKADNALLIEGNSRVFFGDSLTIKMNVDKTTATIDDGDAKIYSPQGWIMFADTLGYTGYAGNLNIYADGKRDTSMRSCMNYGLTCDPRGGFVLFDSIVNINVVDKDGITWIRSNHDDVVMGDMFKYTSANGANNGEFIMQAGQDIYGRNVYGAPNPRAYEDTISFVQPGEKSILLEAKKTIHTQQMLYFDRKDANTGDITLKAGYPTFAGNDYNAGATMSSQAADKNEVTPSADLNKTAGWAHGDCTPYNYVDRFACTDPRDAFAGSSKGGDIWLENRVFFDLSATSLNEIPVTLRAHNSIFIDSTFVYDNNNAGGANLSDVLLFAETGNVEAAVTRQNKGDFPANGYVADDSVIFNVESAVFDNEIRIQAGNQVWNGTEDDAPNFMDCFTLGCNTNAEYNGNILFNKPLVMTNKGIGYTILSSARDIENQVMAPFTFTYDNVNAKNLDITAGRHLETHAMMRFNYETQDNLANITMEAGRLNQGSLTVSAKECKANEYGTTLTNSAGTGAFDPDVETGGVNSSVNNKFAQGGFGNGSILMFDSVEFNYNGKGNILLTALNGNIESDPYLHRKPAQPGNPGLDGLTGNKGTGYMPYDNYPRAEDAATPLQHDAQLTFNHKGTGVTRLEAIDIKLHDKIAYYDSLGTSTTALLPDFGKLEIASYDSILTRNLEYVNHNGDQNLEITSDKYKDTRNLDGSIRDCSGQTCPTLGCAGDANGAIQQGHIVLGYGADWITTDDDRKNMNDSIVINFAGNQYVAGANALIRAGYKGFSSNKVKGTSNSNLFVAGLDKGKAYGGNITFDYMKVDMAKGNHTSGGYMEISTPNGNIWGKDSINYRGINGDLLVDAGLGSIEDLDAIRWNTGGTEAVGGVNNNGHYVAFENSSSCINGKENTLNTNVPGTCDSSMWRTGNIMMKGGSLNFNDSVNGNVAGTGNATFRTREGFIDTYDAFTVDSMQGDLLKYAGTMNSTSAATNEWGDISERDFEYHQVENSGSIFYGADDNIMMNYGYSNGDTKGGEAYEGRGEFDLATGKLADTENPFYSTTYKPSIDAGRSIYNVNRNGYLWYRTEPAKIWMNGLHKLYRGCTARTTAQTGVCSPITGECMTIGNYARDLMFNFDTTAVDGKTIMTGGLGMVATNFIDMFTKFTYFGGQGSGMGSVPGMSSLHGESVSGYGLYLKSQFDGQKVEKRRATCQDCDKKVSFPMEDKSTEATYEWTYIGFHDDARIYTQDQKGLIEAPVIEFFGHAELNPYMAASGKGDPGEGNLTLKGDSLIFHDSAIFDGTNLILTPYTTGEQRQNDMRYGVINDVGKTSNYYKNYGPAIQMPDRNTPILEFGYQRCNEPPKAPQKAPNARSKAGLEATPMVGGDVIISFQHNFSLPIYNTIVANNARISFISDSLDAPGGEYVDTYIRTDLLRIRNKVEFYTGQNEFGKDGNNPKNRSGKFRLSSTEYQEAMDQGTGIFPRHLHMEPGSELSIPGEDTMKIHSMTTAGGYGIIHENISVVANGTIAPGYASLMECDCQSPHRQGQLTVHNLTMEKDAIFRISIGNNNPCYDEDGNIVSNHCTATDTLTVLDSIWFNGKIPVHILPETEELDPGCYLFLDYGDSLGVTPEYVKNFTLPIDRFQDHYFGFDYSTPGKVYLCVMEFPQPIVQRYVKLPAVEGVTTTPNAGTHYVSGHQDFSFTAKYSGTPLKVTATGYYHGGPIDLDQTATILPDGSYQYTIFQVVQPYDVEFGPEISSVQVGNDYIGAPLVYAYKNTLHINVDKEDIVSIYNMIGVLYKKIEVPAGNSKFTLDRGMYVVTLKDGSVYKIVIK